MDKFDRTIALALQRDAGLTNAELAEIVNLSPSQCSRRKSALEASGVILGYTANLNPRALGYNLRAVVGDPLRLFALRWHGSRPRPLPKLRSD